MSSAITSNIFLDASVIFLLSTAAGVPVFYLMNRFVYPYPELPGALYYNNVLIGDGLIFPVFNALLYYLLAAGNIYWSWIPVLCASAAAMIFTICFMYWRIYINPDNDWSRPVIGKFNGGTVYHAVYFFVQSVVVGVAVFLCVTQGRWTELAYFCGVFSIYGILAAFPEWRP